jgi:crotonobetainyl-CoA:carnitine CoA-transferase CaiB-like acyl-CoA transferase
MAGCLDGIKVLDLGRYQAGPRCAMILADLGAEVIKVEEPGGDESRGLGRVYWSAYNRGKKSITLNLRSERGKAVLRELVPKVDMLLQNFRPGVMDAMGFGYETLKQLHWPGHVRLDEFHRLARWPARDDKLTNYRPHHRLACNHRRACGPAPS